MAVIETNFNKGYIAGAVETTPGVALTPTDYFQSYDVNLKTNRNFGKLAPAAGNMYSTQYVVPGLRDHTGDATLVFEPNTAEKLGNMMLAVGSKTGSNPYTSTAVLGTPKTYTLDIYDGSATVQRYFGCQVEKLSMSVSENEVQIKPTISALGSFTGRVATGVTGSSPYVIALDTTYDPAPTTGIVVADKMSYISAAGVVTSFTVSAVSSTTISTTTLVTFTAGDTVALAAQTPSFNLLPQPALWTNTVFGTGATAAAALTNATIANQLRVEPGSTWEISFPFKDNKGEHRSGGQDPAALLRKPAEVSLTVKKFWQGTADVAAFNSMTKSAWVIRHFCYSGANTYEIRVTFNNVTTDDPTPSYKAGEINYSEIKYIARQDPTDGAAFSMTFVNANATLT
jgi:hypothetical protein